MAKLNLKVLGGGCKSCEALLKSTNEAVKELGLEADVECITDMEKIMAYGVMRMPVLAVNDKVVSQGKVLKAKEVVKILQTV